ncbi:response regulator transcription factor [Nonomuraea mesophila]|uniref:Response regulator transcription factor n=1 Tax=Nonomuraea mesophila TaxID=2530382 RepID=A0A4R5EGX3_9ACTN|nr:response regulator transcription factor [Nonomuraea mesophila]TDE33532.1 response regulator transcription factor [Nonomuraea mesophila]
MIGVLVADDQALIRASFRRLVDSAPGFRTIGEAATGAQAVTESARHRPDLVLMDVRMPVMDGIEATRRICADQPRTRVLIVTTFDLDEYVYGALRAGAAGFLLKDTPPAELIKSMNVIASGESLLAPTVTRRLIARFVSPASGVGGLDITEREREVLVLVARGMSNAEIAQSLYVSLSTVKTHVSNLLTKLDARTRVHLVIAAYETHLV